MIRTDELAEAVPNFNVVVQLIMLSQARSIDTVICDGEVLFRHGHLTRLDERVVHEMGRASARRLAARLGFSVRGPGRVEQGGGPPGGGSGEGR